MAKSRSLIFSVAVAATIATIAAAVLLVLTIQQHTRETEESAQRRIAVEAARAMQLSATTLVKREWDSMAEVAKRMEPTDYQGMRRFVDAVNRASDAVVWAGVADVNGQIIVGSESNREGEDVSKSRWFQVGLQHGQVDSVLIADAESSVPGARGGLINMTLPIVDNYGVTRGVMIYSLQIDWLLSFLNNAANVLEVDYEIRSGRGTVVMSKIGLIDIPFTDVMAPFAGGGIEVSKFVDPDVGSPYVMTLLPDFINGNLPDFDWDITVRVPAYTSPDSFLGTINEIRGVLLGMSGSILICATFFALVFLLPIRKLARQAQQLSEGSDIYPLETTTSHEAEQISNALLKLQSRNVNKRENTNAMLPKLVVARQS